MDSDGAHRHLPHVGATSTLDTDDMSAPPNDHVAQARRALGRGLAAWRKSAGLTQVELANRLSYSRSTVANVEIGRNSMPPGFWREADREVNAGGALLVSFAHFDDLQRRHRTKTAIATSHPDITVAPPEDAPFIEVRVVHASEASASASAAAGVVAVARWTRRETVAFREACRLSRREFSVRLGVAETTVRRWEDPRRDAALSLPMQAKLDRLLAESAPEIKVRFMMLLDAESPDSISAAKHAPERPPVIPLRRQSDEAPAAGKR